MKNLALALCLMAVITGRAEAIAIQPGHDSTSARPSYLYFVGVKSHSVVRAQDLANILLERRSIQYSYRDWETDRKSVV